MSNKESAEESRLVQYAATYKGALPDQAQDPVINPPPPQINPAAAKPLLPNNAARANNGVATKTQKYGDSKMSAQGKANVSSSK